MKQAQQLPSIPAVGAKKIKLLIVSDVLLYREGLLASLGDATNVECVGIATGAGAISSARVSCPDVVLLDASLAEGLILASELRVLAPEVRVVGFAVGDSEENILACAEAGLAEFVGKDGTAQDLAAAVERSVRGELRCSSKIASLLFRRVGSLTCGERADGPIAKLTPRERQIALLVREGMSNKEIALALHIGPATVKNYMHKILEKLEVRRRSAVADRLGKLGAQSSRPLQ